MIIRLIKELMDKKFYGEITIKLNNGIPVHILKVESIKEIQS